MSTSVVIPGFRSTKPRQHNSVCFLSMHDTINSYGAVTMERLEALSIQFQCHIPKSPRTVSRRPVIESRTASHPQQVSNTPTKKCQQHARWIEGSAQPVGAYDVLAPNKSIKGN